MNVYIIIGLVGLFALAWFWRNWFWLKKPVLKGAPARTWPAHRVKMGPKPKFNMPF